MGCCESDNHYEYQLRNFGNIPFVHVPLDSTKACEILLILKAQAFLIPIEVS